MVLETGRSYRSNNTNLEEAQAKKTKADVQVEGRCFYLAIQIAICDDRRQDSDFVSVLVQEWSKAREIPVRLACFSSAEAFLFRYEEQKDWDLLLLDIEMEHMDGVRLAKRIRTENDAVMIVFITGYSEYIAEGYEVAALHYLVKPLQREKFFSVLDRAAVKLKENAGSLTIQMVEETVRVPFYTIRYLDVQKNYVTVHAKREHTVKRPLSELANELDGRFFRIGRSCIVNLDAVRRVTKTEVILSDGSALPLPRGSYEPLNRAIISHT